MCQVTKRLLLFACCFALWLAAGTSSRAETMYTISESELTRLEQNLQTSEKNNGNSQQLLIKQQKQLEIVNKQLDESRKSNDRTQKLLEKANQSLDELEKEAQHKIAVKARQRNGWIIATAVVTAVCAI